MSLAWKFTRFSNPPQCVHRRGGAARGTSAGAKRTGAGSLRRQSAHAKYQKGPVVERTQPVWVKAAELGRGMGAEERGDGPMEEGCAAIHTPG